MKILIDCNVLLDVLLIRQPFFEFSKGVIDWAEQNPGDAAAAWHTASNLSCLAGRDFTEFLGELFNFMDIPATGTMDLLHALVLDMPDFEDAMQVAAAEKFGAQVIVTRNVRDFDNAPVKAMTPAEILPLL